MQQVNIELLLGENIYKSSLLGSTTNGLDDNIYLISDPQIKFLGMPLYHIGIGTNFDKSIKSILLTFHKPNYLLFHRKMSDEYGGDYEVMVRDQIVSKTAITHKEDEFEQILQNQEISLKQGTIKDTNIAFIKWKKKGYTIEYIPEVGLNFKKS